MFLESFLEFQFLFLSDRYSFTQYPSPSRDSIYSLPFPGSQWWEEICQRKTQQEIHFYYYYPLYMYLFYLVLSIDPRLLLLSPFADKETGSESLCYLPKRLDQDWQQILWHFITLNCLPRTHRRQTWLSYFPLTISCPSTGYPSPSIWFAFQICSLPPAPVQYRRRELQSLLSCLVKKSFNTALTHHHCNFNFFLCENKWDIHVFVSISLRNELGTMAK